MKEIHYNIEAHISQFEWFALRELRRLQSSGYGTMTLKIAEGGCIDLEVSVKTAHEELKSLQS